MPPLTPAFTTRATEAVQIILTGLRALPPEPEVLDAAQQLRAALRTLQDQPDALTWSQRGLLETAVARWEESQQLLTAPPALQA